MIKFLVVVPTLDSFRDLPLLVRSLQCQSYPYWRVLFVDGPSSTIHRSYLDGVSLEDHRFSWITQSHPHRHIFGAMNQGWLNAAPDEWVLFWGSDDWAANNTVFEDLASLLIDQSCVHSDIIICSARYFGPDQRLTRVSRFGKSGIYGLDRYRRLLFMGFVPPHQATVFKPGVISKVSLFQQHLLIAADLDYFLRLSQCSELRASVLDLDIVHISDGGISQRMPVLRLREVIIAYSSAFRCTLIVPFLMRYFHRLLSLFLKPTRPLAIAPR